jgi:nicotinamidase-related amidase
MAHLLLADSFALVTVNERRAMSMASKELADGDMHGNAPDNSAVAILLIDVINDLEFPEGSQMLEHVLAMAQHLARLVARARVAGIPLIYVNDNFGRWRSDFRAQVEHCLQDGVRGRPVVEQLRPHSQDYFVLKPKPSGFFHTPLGLLLDHIHARSVIITGLTADICVLLTASDAYQRGLRIAVPRDCVASHTPEKTSLALQMMEIALQADTRRGDEIDLAQLAFTLPAPS